MYDESLLVILIVSISLNCYFLFQLSSKKKLKGRLEGRTLLDGLRHSDNRVVILTVLMTLAARVAMRDGKVLDSEKEVMTNHLGLTKDEFAVSNAMFSEAAELPVAEEELTKQIKNIYPETKDREKVLEFLYQIAMADGEYHETEEEYIQTLKQLLDI